MRRIEPGRSDAVRVWEPLELSFAASVAHESPYADVELWIDLEGPGYRRRVYGFWDGDTTFRVRLTATCAGRWSWTSGSNCRDRGLDGHSGGFEAVPPTAADIAANPNWRGMIGVTPDRRGLHYADGSPFFLLADTWWAVPSFRFPLPSGDAMAGIGRHADLRDYLALRQAQGFNAIALLAAMPAWANDGKAAELTDDEGTLLRHAWKTPGTDSAMDMHNEGGRPFACPGRVPGFPDVVPDYDRINPAYFQVLDRKIELIAASGFVPFIEAARRDTGPAWKKYHDWPGSYVRYVQYVFARYQAHNAIFSPIHYDYYQRALPSHEYNVAANALIARYGRPPFGTLLTANANPSTLANFGDEPGSAWLDIHQSGNTREHFSYWWLTEAFRAEPTKPAFNGEPYYSGLHNLGTPYALGRPGDTAEDDMAVRSGMYGSLLSGGYAGYIYGAEGIWSAAVDAGSRVPMWDAFRWSSGATVRHLAAFAFVRGEAYRGLVPHTDALIGQRNAPDLAYDGWCYCAGARDRSWYLLYFEARCQEAVRLRGVDSFGRYRPAWFDPRAGAWLAPGAPIAVADDTTLHLPPRPDDRDWGLLLERVGTPEPA